MRNFKIGDKVKIVQIIGNVDDETQTYEGLEGEIVAYGSPSKLFRGYYVKPHGKYAKRFYENEIIKI